MQTQHLTVLLTDIKGFTSRTARQSRSQMMELLNKHREVVMPVVEKYKGRLVKTIGDAFLVTFESPTDAVLCGVSIQDALRSYNSDKAGDERIDVRIAINSGEVTLADDGDIYGDAVNITSRLESIAEAGEVFFTEAVYLAMNKREVPSSEIGYRQFRGIPEKIKVYRVLREVPVGSQHPGEAPVLPPAAQEIPETVSAAAAVSVVSSAPVSGMRAGFWRRLAAIVIDLFIFLVIAGMITGKSGADMKVRRDGKTVSEISPDKISINSDGIELTGDKGEQIKLGSKGIEIRDPEGNLIKAFAEVKKNKSDRKFPLRVLLWILYGGIFLKYFGATPGKMILKLRVICPGGMPLAWKQAFLRSAFSVISAMAALLGYLWAVWEQEGRTWHDLIAGTKVILQG
ncbi:MAG: adenylate/guanylate cyclase domain-containing protein [bacterium]